MVNDTLIETDLRALESKIYRGCDYYSNPKVMTSPDEKAHLWKGMFGHKSPQNIYQAIAHDFDDAVILLSQDWVDFIHTNGKAIAHTSVAGNFSKGDSLSLEDMEIEDAQGAGTATKIMSNLVTLLETDYPHIKKVETISVDVGAYAWARLGFLPDRASWEEMKRRKQDGDSPSGLWERMPAIRTQLSEEENRAIDKIINSKNPRSLWIIADMGKEIDDPHTGKRTTLGKFLLMDNWWEGALNLTDTQAMHRFKGYAAKLGQIKEKILNESAKER